MSEKKPPGPREQQLRDMREARVAKNKALIDKSKVKAVGKVGKVTNIKTAKRGGRGR